MNWKALQRQFRATMQALLPVRHVGWTGWADGTVADASRPNYIRVTLHGTETEAWNDGVPAVYNLQVDLYSDPDYPGLLRARQPRLTFTSDFPYVCIQFHRSNHGWPGPDTVMVELRQFMPLHPSVSGFNLTIRAGWVKLSTGLHYRPGETIDLTTSRPTTGARYVLVSIDDNGDLVVTDGDLVANLFALELSDIPELPTGNKYNCAIRLYAGQVAIKDQANGTDLLDLRFTPGGDGGGIVNYDDLIDRPESAMSDGSIPFVNTGLYTEDTDLQFDPATGRLSVGEVAPGNLSTQDVPVMFGGKLVPTGIKINLSGGGVNPYLEFHTGKGIKLPGGSGDIYWMPTGYDSNTDPYVTMVADGLNWIMTRGESDAAFNRLYFYFGTSPSYDSHFDVQIQGNIVASFYKELINFYKDLSLDGDLKLTTGHQVLVNGSPYYLKISDAYTHPNHSGDVTSVGDGAQTIANNAVTNAKLADMAANTIKGALSAGDPADLTAAQAKRITQATNYKTGLKISFVSTTQISVGTGEAWINNEVLTVASALTSGAITAADDLYHVYLYNNSGTVAIEVSTTDPASTPYFGTAYTKNGDTTRRYLGSILTTAAGGVQIFQHNPETGLMIYSTTAAPRRVLNNGGATTKTAQSVAAVAPPTAIAVQIIPINNNATYAMSMVDTNDSVFMVISAGSTRAPTPIGLDGVNLYYKMAGAGNGAFIDIAGYFFQS